MKRAETRYVHVWDAGYEAALEAVSRDFWAFLREGGEIVAGDPSFLQPRFTIRLKGVIGEAHSLAAVMPFRRVADR